MTDKDTTSIWSSDVEESIDMVDENAGIEEVTVWAPEPGPDSDEVLGSSIDEWISSVEFSSTEDVPIPDRLVDQVIGQEAGSVVIKKADDWRPWDWKVHVGSLND